MQTNWIVIILSVLLTMGLLMVVQSQYQLKRILDSKIETMEVALEKSSDDYQSKDLFKTTVEKLLAQGQKHVDDMEAALNKLSSETEQKKAENDACQEKMKNAQEELESIQKTQSETKASLDAEVEAWTQEINTLKETLVQHSPICAYVKRSELSDNICGINLNKDTA
ncbi:uncharacterized protein LOC143414541 [Maylandia zebra]|uniref:uncharacterized protein LOC143414541 n=1 Tax=Maylandia zebra TaxID=106582 RepID=UPI0003299E5F